MIFFNMISLNHLKSFLIEISNRKIRSLWDEDEQSNEIKLRKWYYQQRIKHKDTFEISNWCIQYKDNLSYDLGTRNKLNLSQIKSLSFDCWPVTLSSQKINQGNDHIYLNQKNIQFDIGLIKSAKYRTNSKNKIYFIDQEVKTKNEYQAEVRYFKRKNFINLKITDKALSENDVENLILKMSDFGQIRSLSLLVEQPSSAIQILDWCEDVPSIMLIRLEVIESFNFSQYWELNLAVSQLKQQGKVISIYEMNKVLKSVNFT